MTPPTQPTLASSEPAHLLPGVAIDDHQEIVSFPHGLPGFADCRSFVVFAADSADFQWLTSVEGPPASFLTVDPRRIVPTLRYTISAADLARLDATDDAALLWLAIVLVESDGTVSVNLRAPIVINPATMIGYQVTPPDTLYPIRYILAAPAK
jgi:flagellar assembly factor FliW